MRNEKKGRKEERYEKEKDEWMKEEWMIRKAMGIRHSDQKHLENWTKIIDCPTTSGANE